MKITISELMTKINCIQFTIDSLREKGGICDKAADLLDEYIGVLLGIKVDI